MTVATKDKLSSESDIPSRKNDDRPENMTLNLNLKTRRRKMKSTKSETRMSFKPRESLLFCLVNLSDDLRFLADHFSSVGVFAHQTPRAGQAAPPRPRRPM